MPDIHDRVPSPTPKTTGLGCLVRLAWMIGGTIALVLVARGISQHRGSFLSVSDLVYWLIAAAVFFLRYMDIKKLNGLTATGNPATVADLKRYALLLGGFALAVWGLAHGLAQSAT